MSLLINWTCPCCIEVFFSLEKYISDLIQATCISCKLFDIEFNLKKSLYSLSAVLLSVLQVFLLLRVYFIKVMLEHKWEHPDKSRHKDVLILQQIWHFFPIFQKLTCCRVQSSGKDVRFYYSWMALPLTTLPLQLLEHLKSLWV